MFSSCCRFTTVAKRNSIKSIKHGFATASKNFADVKNVTVIGGGLSGSGIAQVTAENGYNVVVVDSDEFQQKCLVSISKSLDIISKKRFPDDVTSAKEWRSSIFRNIKTTNKLESSCENADLVIESVIENADIKKEIYAKVDAVLPEHGVLGTNTSSLSIEALSKDLACADRFIGLHFFNPVWKMKLVEIIPLLNTKEEAIEQASSYAKAIGKTAVVCQDTPGFIVNQLLYPYFMEALHFMEDGHASIGDIDKAMKLGAGLPKGPFELMDIIGVDTVQQVMKHWNEKYPDDPRFSQSETIDKMVSERKLGMKTSKGFYEYKHSLY